MGLAVSQSIMRDHGGEMTFESGPEGARFFVTMPMAPADASAQVYNGSSVARRPMNVATHATILVVDDDREMADVVCDVLREAGYDAAGANSGAEALALVKRECPDVLISDLRMSGMSGHQLQLELKRVAPNLPVIIITAFGSIQTAVESMKLRRVRLHHQAVQQR